MTDSIFEEFKKRHPTFPLPTRDESRDGLIRTVTEISERLLPYAAPRVGIAREDLEKRFKRARLVFSSDVNGYVCSRDNWQTFEVLLNRGLMMFYHKMVKVFVGGNIGIGKGESHAIEKPLEFSRAISTCKALMEAFWEDRLEDQGGFWFAEFGETQMCMTAALVHCCECFTLAHEWGHAVIRLSNGKLVELATAKKLVEGFLSSISGLSAEERGRWLEYWTEEIAADLIGLHLSLELPDMHPFDNCANYKQWIYGGAEIALILIAMLEAYHDKIHHGPKMTLVRSHPPGLLRLKAIRLSPERSTFSDDLRFGQRCGAFAKKVLAECGPISEDSSFVPMMPRKRGRFKLFAASR